MGERTCSIEGCIYPTKARGWCGAHYRRWRKYGNPLTMVRPECAKPWRVIVACSVADCERPVHERGLCMMHNGRMRTHGSVDIVHHRWDGHERLPCAVAGCDVLSQTEGLCPAHWGRMKRWGDPLAGRRPNAVGTEPERFWSMVCVGESSQCWLWNAGRYHSGYGSFHGDDQSWLAHRWSFQYHGGVLDPALVLDHTCHNADLTCPGGRRCDHQRCVNPSHLEQVTLAENFRRGHERKRRRRAMLAQL